MIIISGQMIIVQKKTQPTLKINAGCGVSMETTNILIIYTNYFQGVVCVLLRLSATFRFRGEL